MTDSTQSAAPLVEGPRNDWIIGEKRLSGESRGCFMVIYKFETTQLHITKAKQSLRMEVADLNFGRTETIPHHQEGNSVIAQRG
jgi:hypothetical protein